MYLTKPQYEAIIKINIGKHALVAPEIIQFLLDNGLITNTLIDYELTDAGRISCDEMYAERQKQVADTKTNQSGKQDFFKDKRDSFREDDDLSIPKKKRSVESMANIKPKPQTKYKETK